LELELHGKVAVVTGAGRGIGRAVALRLAAEGLLVMGASRKEPSQAVPGILHLETDLRDPEAPAALIDWAAAQHGRLDLLVNNVGTGKIRSGSLEESDEDWAAILNLNLLTAVRATRAAMPWLLQSRGVVVNVSSINGRLAEPSIAGYSASKAALNSFSKSLATQYGPQGVRVGTVSPGPTATDLWLGPDGAAAQIAALEGTDEASVVAQAEASIPLLRFATPEEMANCIAFLASPLAGAVTGADLLIDGGVVPTT
jgi:NAD(P)-dependent dehydrogenase (short-subunit alcohol dehydrogenase family)